MARITYHVAGESYHGGTLLCRDRLEELGIEVPWKWDDAEEGFDGDVVCLFEDRSEAEAFQAEYGGRLLEVEIPEEIDTNGYDLPWGGALFPRLVRTDEGYLAVQDGIPEAWIRRYYMD